MLVVVITDNDLRHELLAQMDANHDDHDLQLHFVTRPEEYKAEAIPDVCIDLLFDGSAARINQLRKTAASLKVINAVSMTLKNDGPGFVRINGWPGFLERPVIEAASTDDKDRDIAQRIFALLGKKTEWVPDICGFISARVVATIINEAFFALEEEISTENEIDTAMKLGTNYPFGPFEWAEKIGIGRVFALLRDLSAEESRYLPCKLLEKKALA